MDWKRVKPLESEDLIEQFEQEVHFTFPEDFKACVKHYNGARPMRRLFDTDRSKDRVMKSLLSFNPGDREPVWKIRAWNEGAAENRYVAIAIDPFGNLICFDTEVGGTHCGFLYGVPRAASRGARRIISD